MRDSHSDDAMSSVINLEAEAFSESGYEMIVKDHSATEFLRCIYYLLDVRENGH